jgi:thiosulfate reductase cytochrome b subunit
MAIANDSAAPEPRRYQYVRHSVPVRIMHWINVLALTVLLMSGLQIFNAHPALYWGKSSYSGRPPVLEMRAQRAADGRPVGVTDIFGHSFRTTGLFGLSTDSDGGQQPRGFPSWLTLPSNQWLAMARRWHFFFEWIFILNGLAYLTYSFWSRHLLNDLIPTSRDWRSVGRSFLDHLFFRHPVGEQAKHYNVLQKITYLGVIFGLLPFMVLMGLGLSPRWDALWPGWVDVFGGRQSARTLHFVAAMLLVLFVAVHVFEVLVSGVWNNLRSMLTGHYEIIDAKEP